MLRLALMAICACPVCGRETPALPGLSVDSIVFYFRCDGCRHIWTVNKVDPAKIDHVTPLPLKTPPQ